MSQQGTERPNQVIFGVPLISRAKAEDWAWTTHQFNATLGSLFRQTVPAFRVIVALWDEPDISVQVDERLELLRIPDVEPAPGDRHKMRRNIRTKRHAIARRARELGGGYLMFVDADDLIRPDLVSFLRNYPHPSGYVMAEGYVLNASTGEIAPYPMPGYEKWTFDYICGTSNILRFSPDELPAGDLPAEDDPDSVFWRIYAKGHQGVRPFSEELGRPLAELPLRAVTYVRADRHSLSFRLPQDDPSRVFHSRLLSDLPQHAIPRTTRLDERFNLRAAIAPKAAGAADHG